MGTILCEQDLRTLIDNLVASPAGLDVLRSALESNGLSFRQRIENMTFPKIADLRRLHYSHEGILLDTETTGLGDDAKLIQLAMLKIRYDSSGIVSVGEEFDRFCDPGIPIPPEASRVNGITDAMVRDKTIHESEVQAFIKGARKVFCHNAEFDRKVVERELPGAGFDALEFDCSLTQINWRARGMTSSALEFLAFKSGYVYDAHNALSDIKVMVHVLSHKGSIDATPFEEMLEWSKYGNILLVAKGAPINKKDLLKARGYRWAPNGTECGGAKAWFLILPDTVSRRADEAEFLMNEIYDGKNTVLPAAVFGGRNRYSTRQLSQWIDFDLDRERNMPEDPSFQEWRQIMWAEAVDAQSDDLPGNY